MADRRVEALVRAATDDLVPLAEKLRAMGWPVGIQADSSNGTYTVSLVVTVIPVKVDG